jgi:coatomer protein complex subunit alpha (xenin)
VKGIAFHPSRPWILATLHSGAVQLWDYRIKTIVDRFEEHDGPVRGVHFHSSQPLFVTGGDDYKIKVWNYKQRRCLFTLLGHLDYVRTVFFHNEYPWIVSASDDQTIRLWNWQARSCIAVLTGHNHYVMCAQFHHTEDLVVSASLDQTVRVWDISGLRKRNVAPAAGAGPGGLTPYGAPVSSNNPYGGPGGLSGPYGGAGLRGPGGPGSSDELRSLQNDLFGNTDAIVRYVLEGHVRGVNWATFHPTSPLIISGADDRQLKMWRMNDTKAWEVDSFRGHYNNVSCCLFHPRRDLILSNSEDKTIRVWDMAKRNCIASYRREHDRFWILAAHPEVNLFAAGHDSGLIVFKLERERPAYTVSRNSHLFYIRDRYLRHYDLATNRDVPLLQVRRPPAAQSSGDGSRAPRAFGPQFRRMSYSPADRAVLINSDVEGGHYDLYVLPKRRPQGGDAEEDAAAASVDPHRGTGQSAVFIGRQRFAVLKNCVITVKNLKNEEVKQCQPSHVADAMFAGPVGQVLLRSEDRVSLYDIQQRRQIAAIDAPPIKFAYWSTDPKRPMVALLAKDTIIIANKRLEQLCAVHETIRIKSGAWDELGVFLYTTLNHLKYVLPNGDSGIVRTLDVPVYLTAVRGNRVYCLDREGKNRVFQVDSTEYVFKDALIRRKYDLVLKMVRESNLIGQSIVSYLQRKGFPEVALHFVKDPLTRLNLALESGAISVALEAAKVLDNPEAWQRLAAAALRQGNHQVVEMSYQRTKDFEKLSFLYLITGNIPKLRKMLKIAEIRSDVMGRFHNTLYLGDVADRVELLRGAGQPALAYLAARVHGLTEQAEAVAADPAAGTSLLKLAVALGALTEEEAAAEDVVASFDASRIPLPASAASGSLLHPPVPILRLADSNWPLLRVSGGYFTGGGVDESARLASGALGAEEGEGEGEVEEDDDLGDLGSGEAGGDAWGIDGLDDEGGAGVGEGDDGLGLGEEEGGEGWGGDDDLDGLDGLDDVALDVGSGGGKTRGAEAYWVVPTAGPGAQATWAKTSPYAADAAAAGNAQATLAALSATAGVVRLAPTQATFTSLLYGATLSLPGVPGVPSLLSPTLRGPHAGDERPAGGVGKGRWGLPKLTLSLPMLIARLRDAYRATTEGKFATALREFRGILAAASLLVVRDRTEQGEARELVMLCREYTLGLSLEMARKQEAAAETPNVTRVLELAAYFTHCGLQPAHLQLALRSAMIAAHKAKCHSLASSFGRRLLDLGPKPPIATQAKKVIRFAESAPPDALSLRYDERNPFVLDASLFLPLYKGTPYVRCALCGASFGEGGGVCAVCEMAEVGADAGGLRFLQDRS